MSVHFKGLPQSDSKRARMGMRMDFAKIGAWQDAALDSHHAAPESLIALADAMTKPHQTSHLLDYLLHTSVDHLHALKMLMEDAGAQHTFAPFTLIRGAIESASTALWVLQHDDPRSVAVRTLKLEYIGLTDQAKAAQTVDATSGIDEIRLEIFNDCLVRNGLTGEGIKGRSSGHLTIIKEASEHFNIPRSALTWQMCSAAAHGRSWAKRVLTLFEAHEDDGVSKVVDGRLASNEMAIAVALDVACNVVQKARDVRSLHSRHRSHTGASFVKPQPTVHGARQGLWVPARIAE